jgi:hypothetical protein
MPVEKISVPLYVFVPDREPNLMTNSHVKLDTLVDTQESFSTSHHRIDLGYDKDTVNLVGMVQAWGDQKHLKRDILGLFSMSKGTIYLR